MLATKLLFGSKVFEEKIINEKVRKPIERLETRFLGYEKQIIDTVEVVVGQVEEIVGRNYLQVRSRHHLHLSFKLLFRRNTTI